MAPLLHLRGLRNELVTTNKMEPHTDALEIVCKHFRQEYGTEAMAKLRREKHCFASQNYRLRKKVELLNLRIDGFVKRYDILLGVYRKLVVQMHRARESLSVALPYL